MGKISERRTRITHSTATIEIKNLIKKHPEYPITVLAGEEANNGDFNWMYCTNVTVYVDEILDCDTDYWKSEYVCVDRDDFEESAKHIIYDELKKKISRSPTEEELEAEWKKVKDAHEPYWKKCIAIRAWN